MELVKSGLPDRLSVFVFRFFFVLDRIFCLGFYRGLFYLFGLLLDWCLACRRFVLLLLASRLLGYQFLPVTLHMFAFHLPHL